MKESETLELKRSTSELKEALMSMSAMLNKHGRGELYFGVRDDGRAVGQAVTARTLREISQAVSNHIEPRVFPAVRETIIEGKTCIHVEFSGGSAPYYAYGRAYIRVGEEDRQLSARELESMILGRNEEKLRWDNKPCKGATLVDISLQKIRSYLKKADLPHDTARNALKKLWLLAEEQPQNAAILLFGKNPERFLQNARLRCAVFATADTTTLLDMQDYAGDVFQLIGQAEQYVLRNIHIGMRLEGLYRVDVPEIDKDAVREAIINAFCHRDWWNPDPVAIAVFRNRVEVRSPGLLYGGLTVTRIMTEMVSERRNKVLADLFHRIHLVEQWGRGITLIRSKAPGTTFKEVGMHFIVVFRREGRTAEPFPGTRVETRMKTRVKIISLMKEDPRITIPELAEQVSLSVKGIQWNIRKLKREGLLRRVGPDKGGRWEVLEGAIPPDGRLVGNPDLRQAGRKFK